MVREIVRVAGLLGPLALCLGLFLSGCSADGPSDGQTGPAGASGESSGHTLDFGVVVAEAEVSAGRAQLVPQRDPDKAALPVSEPLLRVRLASVHADVDSMGYPAVFFEIDASDIERFQAFTGKHVGSQMAAIVDGTVITAPRIAEPLPGRGVLSGRFSTAEAQTLVRKLSPAQPTDG